MEKSESPSGTLSFDFEDATINAGSHNLIDTIAKFMIDYPYRRLKLEGHADLYEYKDETEDARKRLSERRATEIIRRLEELTVSPGRITHQSFGSTAPQEDAPSPANRRVLFDLIGSPESC